MKTGTELILHERQRQISEEGWTAAHDDRHDNQELRKAGEAYLLYARWQLGKLSKEPILKWPWAKRWWKPCNPIRNLTKAGALFLAEIDRMKRLSAPKSTIRPLANKCELCARAIEELQTLKLDDSPAEACRHVCRHGIAFSKRCGKCDKQMHAEPAKSKPRAG